MIPFWKKTDKGGKKKPQKPAVPRTAQQSIPMQRMFEDGTCRVKPNYYTRTIQYQDINYQLAQQEDKTAIFEEWCSFLNFFDSSIKFELSFVNMATDSTEFEKSIRIPYQRDGFDDVRAEYSQMLRQQLVKGNNGLTKTKFITFGVEGESMAQVKPRLDHIQNDLLNNFHRLGVQAKPLNGAQRLKLMHDMFNMDGASKFHFDWKDLVKSGLSVKDAIAPTAFAFKNSRTFQMGGIFCAASFLSITASDISDQLLKDFLDMDSSQIVTMHIQSVDQNKAIKTVKRTITELDRSKIEEQKKAIRAGYDIDIIPSDLATYGRDAKALLKELQSQNERMFLVTFLVLNTGRTEQELENNVFQASSIAQKHNCNLCRLDFQQEQGLMSSLPLADCQIEIQRGLTTSSTAIFIPFTTQELYQSGKESLYYGLNALSNNLIMVDRKKLKNPNGLILGTPGSGKSFSAKREITNAFLVTDDDIIICDPEAEYAPLVERLHGQVIHIGPASTQYINPMDINSNYSEEDNPLALKADFILSLCELVVGGKEGLQPVEKTVIDRCVHVVYRKYFENPTPENMPLLEDLYNALLTQDEPEARHVAAALEIYVKGSLNIFNHHTNVDIHNRIVCFDIKQLGKQLKKLGMLIVQDAVWGRVTANRSAGKSTRYYADEFHLLLKEEQTAAYSVEIWKRFRKWGGIPTALTQNVKDLLASPEVSNIFENSDFVYALTKAQPRELEASEIDVRLGATWLDPDVIQKFMTETFQIPYYLRHAVKVRYSPYTAEWRVEGKTATGRGDIISSETYGTSRANAYKILEETLNLKDVRIYDTIEDAEGKPKRVLNKRETMLAQQKQQVIKDAFANWVWQDPQRRIALVKQYNELFNSTRPREYDGSHIKFVGMNPEITLREHQRNAIAHVLYGGNTLLAHEVGAGKTYEMAASAMEAKRLGLCQKSLFVVPNHLTEQWASEFLNLYPNAKLLVARRKDFETANRKKFCARIATGDYDAVIIGHSQFERIPLSFERQERIIQEQIYETLAAINELKVHAGENFSIKQMEKTRKTLEAKLEKLRSDERKDDVVTFEQLGVDRLFVDESHAFKNCAKRCA